MNLSSEAKNTEKPEMKMKWLLKTPINTDPSFVSEHLAVTSIKTEPVEEPNNLDTNSPKQSPAGLKSQKWHWDI